MGPSYPIFTCPNCRAAADLDADIDEPIEDWQQLDSDAEDDVPEIDAPSPSANPADTSNQNLLDGDEMTSAIQTTGEGETTGDVTVMLDAATDLQQQQQSPPFRHVAASSPLPIPQSSRTSSGPLPSSARSMRTPSPNRVPLTEGPLTPRNDAGPWVFDGDAGRASQEVSRQGAMTSLDASTRVD
jgi:hypothetical protein